MSRASWGDGARSNRHHHRAPLWARCGWIRRPYRRAGALRGPESPRAGTADSSGEVVDGLAADGGRGEGLRHPGGDLLRGLASAVGLEPVTAQEIVDLLVLDVLLELGQR